jgi:hypothetical protein
MSNNENEDNKEKITFIKYGLASMINEYNSLEDPLKRKEYLDAVTEWYIREKGNREYNLNKEKE